jgi:small subunit ribosomal protein S3
MGQKVNPTGFRLGYIKDHDSRWFAGKEYAEWLHEDIRLRKFIRTELDGAMVSRVEIERLRETLTIQIHAGRPGAVIGKRGAGIEELERKLAKQTTKKVSLKIMEIRRPELDATLVAESVCRQLEGRVAFRRAMKRTVQTTMKFGARGIRVECGGRLGGSEMGRFERYLEGRVPLHTLRADIDYGTSVAHTTYGTIGCKVWIYKGEILPQRNVGDRSLASNR